MRAQRSPSHSQILLFTSIFINCCCRHTASQSTATGCAAAATAVAIAATSATVIAMRRTTRALIYDTAVTSLQRRRVAVPARCQTQRANSCRPAPARHLCGRRVRHAAQSSIPTASKASAAQVWRRRFTSAVLHKKGGQPVLAQRLVGWHRARGAARRGQAAVVPSGPWAAASVAEGHIGVVRVIWGDVPAHMMHLLWSARR